MLASLEMIMVDYYTPDMEDISHNIKWKYIRMCIVGCHLGQFV